MSGLSEYAQKAERYAKDNPEKVDQGIEGGEKFAKQRTDHRYDEQINAGGEQIEHHLGADQQAGQEGAQPDGGQRQEQTQEYAQNDDQEANHS